MKTRKIWANLGVEDLNKTTDFYTHLGFKANGTPTSEITSFSFGDANFIINFFTKERLIANTNLTITDSTQGNEVIFSLSAESKAEVEEWLNLAKNAGGTIISGPEDFEKGYVFTFGDPDGHKFNVLYWPGM